MCDRVTVEKNHTIRLVPTEISKGSRERGNTNAKAPGIEKALTAPYKENKVAIEYFRMAILVNGKIKVQRKSRKRQKIKQEPYLMCGKIISKLNH